MEIKILPLRINNKKSTFYRSGKLLNKLYSITPRITLLTKPRQDRTRTCNHCNNATALPH